MTDEQLQTYFQRIGFEQLPRVDFKTVAEIQRLHIASIPFENISVLEQNPIDLSLNAIFQKMVENKRGGYCFEHNLLLKAVLKKIGFNVRGLLGRAGKDEYSAGRTHLILLVIIASQNYIVDVGYGGFVPTAPLVLATEIEQFTPNESYRIVKQAHDFQMQINIVGKWKRLYDFDLQHQKFNDYVVANWYTSTAPQSLFTQHLVVALAQENKRLSLFNKTFSRYQKGKANEKTVIKSAEELNEVLTQYFNLQLTTFRQLFQLLDT